MGRARERASERGAPTPRLEPRGGGRVAQKVDARAAAERRVGALAVARDEEVRRRRGAERAGG